jgi:flagellar protein FlaG
MIKEIPRLEVLATRPTQQLPRESIATDGVAGATKTAVALPVEASSNDVSTAETQRARAENLAQELKQLVQNLRRELNFRVDDDTGRLVIRVIDAETDEVVRQIPPDRLLELQQRLSEIQESGSPADASVMDGMLFNAKV